MTNEECLEFLKGKPNYNCRFHPTEGWHSVGCSHKTWTVEQLQSALDSTKRSLELQLKLRNSE